MSPSSQTVEKRSITPIRLVGDDENTGGAGKFAQIHQLFIDLQFSGIHSDTIDHQTEAIAQLGLPRFTHID